LSQRKVHPTTTETEYEHWDPYWACVAIAALLGAVGYGIYRLVIFIHHPLNSHHQGERHLNPPRQPFLPKEGKLLKIPKNIKNILKTPTQNPSFSQKCLKSEVLN